MWIVVYLEEHLTASALALAVQAIVLAVSLANACNGLVESGPYLEKNGLGADIWCTRLLVQNGNNYKTIRVISFRNKITPNVIHVNQEIIVSTGTEAKQIFLICL